MFVKANSINRFLLSAAFIFLSVAASQIYVKAGSSENTVINLPSSSSSYTYKYVTRSTNYSYISVHADSVYPTNGGSDNYTYFKSKLVNLYTTGTLSGTYSVYETNTGLTKVYLNEGTLSTTQLQIAFNNPYNGVSISTVADYYGN